MRRAVARWSRLLDVISSYPSARSGICRRASPLWTGRGGSGTASAPACPRIPQSIPDSRSASRLARTGSLSVTTIALDPSRDVGVLISAPRRSRPEFLGFVSRRLRPSVIGFNGGASAWRQIPKFWPRRVSGGYQYADIPAMGPSAIVVTDNDPGPGQAGSGTAVGYALGIRDKLEADAAPLPAAAVRSGDARRQIPDCADDTGDNIGGGSSGDSTFILTELLGRRAEGWGHDDRRPRGGGRGLSPPGVGQPFDQWVGGKTDPPARRACAVRGRREVAL